MRYILKFWWVGSGSRWRPWYDLLSFQYISLWLILFLFGWTPVNMFVDDKWSKWHVRWCSKIMRIARVLGKDESPFYFSFSMSLVAINASWTLSPLHLFNIFVWLWYEITTISMLTLPNVMEKFATLSISLLLLQLMIQARDNLDWRYWRWDPNMSDYAAGWVRSYGGGVARWLLLFVMIHRFPN